MQLTHRKINLESDRAYVLERHCQTNYASDCPWKRKMPYSAYREEWFGMQGQTNGFLSALAESMQDPRTLAEIIETEEGVPVGYLWVWFCVEPDSGFCYADVQDIFVEEPFRATGIATALLEYAETSAKENGATVIRSGTGCENLASIGLHNKLGYYQYRREYEKML